MDRREYLRQIALLTGAAVVGADIFLSGCAPSGGSAFFNAKQIAWLDEIGETILPATDTPGAKAAAVGKFMEVMVRDCYTPEEQAAFRAGMEALQTSCQKQYGNTFESCTPAQRKEVLIGLEKEAKQHNEKKEKSTPVHYYTMMKQLTLWGFFTSETGMTQTLRHLPVPGKYDGAFPYAQGDKAWAE